MSSSSTRQPSVRSKLTENYRKGLQVVFCEPFLFVRQNSMYVKSQKNVYL